MIIFRTQNVGLVDLIINHESVRYAAAGDPQAEGRLTCEDLIGDEKNILIASEIGLVAFIRVEDNVYQAHVFVLEGRRGAPAIAFGKAALAMLFNRYGAHKCVASVALPLRVVRRYARSVGFVSLGVDAENNVELFTMESV